MPIDEALEYKLQPTARPVTSRPCVQHHQHTYRGTLAGWMVIEMQPEPLESSITAVVFQRVMDLK